MGASQSSVPLDIRGRLLRFTNYSDVGTEPRPSIENSFINNYENPLCGCGTVVCKMQSYCLDNRCLSVKLKNGCFVVHDGTYHKNFTFPTKLTKDQILPKKMFESTGLHPCNVICFYRAVIVIQVFCLKSIKLLICDCVTSQIQLEHEFKYIGPRKLSLFECYISPHRRYLILKTNHMYQMLCCNGNGIVILKLFRLDYDEGVFTELMCSDLPHANFGITFDRTMNGNYILIVTLRDEEPVITRHLIKYGLNDFDVINLIDSPCKFCFTNTQSSPHGNHVLISILGCHSSYVNVPAIIQQYSVVLHYVDNETLKVSGRTSYVSPESVFHYAPKLSNSGRYISCGGKVYLVPHNKMKSLLNNCCDVVSDMTLAEDIQLLPLPESLKQYIKDRL